jgi:hypothetical protein
LAIVIDVSKAFTCGEILGEGGVGDSIVPLPMVIPSCPTTASSKGEVRGEKAVLEFRTIYGARNRVGIGLSASKGIDSASLCTDADWPVRQPYSYSVPSANRLF